MKFKPIICAAALFALTACAQPDFAENTTTLDRTLTVREIDREARSFAVTGDGQRFNITVSEEVVNFDQIEVGDKLNVTFIESVAVGMALPGDTGETISAGGAIRAPAGSRPAMVGAEVTSAVMTFVSYDPLRQTAVLQRNDGSILETSVAPEMRAFAAARQPGDRIAIDFTEALAVAITPAV